MGGESALNWRTLIRLITVWQSKQKLRYFLWAPFYFNLIFHPHSFGQQLISFNYKIDRFFFTCSKPYDIWNIDNISLTDKNVKIWSEKYVAGFLTLWRHLQILAELMFAWLISCSQIYVITKIMIRYLLVILI